MVSLNLPRLIQGRQTFVLNGLSTFCTFWRKQSMIITLTECLTVALEEVLTSQVLFAVLAREMLQVVRKFSYAYRIIRFIYLPDRNEFIALKGQNLNKKYAKTFVLVTN